MSIAILLADDHENFRQGLRSLLEQEPGLLVIAEADDGKTAVELARTLRPDVAVIGNKLQQSNGIRVAREMLTRGQGTKIIILSMHGEKQYLLEAIREGVKGFVVKDCELVEIVTAIREVAAGRPYLSPMLCGALIELSISPSHGADYRLSPGESKFLQLTAAGKDTKEVASILNVSSQTVENCRRHLMEKLDITSSTNLVKFAIREGLSDLA